MKKTKLGVVLSGGGAKGAYEVGFLKALAEFNIQPDAIAGTSIGALNGAIYSAKKDTKVTAKILEEVWKGIGEDGVLEIDKEKAVKTIIEVSIHFAPMGNVTKLGSSLSLAAKGAKSQKGILTQDPLINRLEKFAPPKDLKTGLPFFIGLTEAKGHAIDLKNFLGLGNKETVYKKIQNLNSEDMHKAIMASASLPILFDSLEVKDGDKVISCSDGCLSSTDNEWGNTPVKPLVEEEKCTHIIVCHLNEGSFFDRHDELFSNIPIIEIRPKANTFTSALDPLKFSVDKIDKWIEQGYKDSKRILKESLEALAVVKQREITEIATDISVSRLKNRNFKLG